jgi:hypothetical protein
VQSTLGRFVDELIMLAGRAMRLQDGTCYSMKSALVRKQ